MSDDCWPEGVPKNLPAQDRGDITELYARYAWGLDLADEELLLSAVAEDGTFDHQQFAAVCGGVHGFLAQADAAHFEAERQPMAQHLVVVAQQGRQPAMPGQLDHRPGHVDRLDLLEAFSEHHGAASGHRKDTSRSAGPP